MSLAAGLIPAATMSPRPASRRWWNSIQKSQTLYRRVSSACGASRTRD